MKLVILDRDGVINHDSPDYIKSPEEWHPIEGSLEAIATLNRNGYVVCVATNQSGIGRGLYSEETLERIHAKMERAVREAGGVIAHIRFCPHHPDERCHCRKPEIGLLEQIAEAAGVPLAGVPFVGDALSDIEAAERARCLPILVRTGKGERTALQLGSRSIATFDHLAEVVRAILSGNL